MDAIPSNAIWARRIAAIDYSLLVKHMWTYSHLLTILYLLSLRGARLAPVLKNCKTQKRNQPQVVIAIPTANPRHGLWGSSFLQLPLSGIWQGASGSSLVSDRWPRNSVPHSIKKKAACCAHTLLRPFILRVSHSWSQLAQNAFQIKKSSSPQRPQC